MRQASGRARLSDPRTSPRRGQGQKVCRCPWETFQKTAGEGARAGVSARSGTAPLRQADLPCSLRSVSPMSSSQVRTSDAYLLFYELASPPSRM